MTDMLHDYLIMDGTEEAADEFEFYAAIQRQINNGAVWSMQGTYGRIAMDAILAGRCMVGTVAHRGFWGNMIPARDMLQTGSVGTFDYVAEQHGDEWADCIAAIDAPARRRQAAVANSMVLQ